jgi:hypothetical protein
MTTGKNQKKRPTGALLAVLGLLISLSGDCLKAQERANAPERVLRGSEPQPEEAIKAILGAFDKYEVVGMGAAHGSKDGDDLILRLVRDPAFPDKVNDVVVECGNSLYQPVLDRYIAGEDVSISQARHVWRDTTQPMCSVSGFYEILFPLIRRINERLPRERRLRMLAGDPPLDWSKVKERTEVMLDRDANIAAVMEKEALAKHRKALMLFGTFHLYHSDHSGPKQLESAVGLYEMKYPGVTFVIGGGIVSRSPIPAWVTSEMEERMAAWPVPSLVQNLKGTWLEAVDERYFSTMADAFLYLGPTDLLLAEPRPAEIFLNKEYMAELRRRAAIIGDGNGILTAQTEDNNIHDENFSPFLFGGLRSSMPSRGTGEQPEAVQTESPQKTSVRPQAVPLSLDFLAAFAGQYETESPSHDKIQVVAGGEGLSVRFGTGMKHRFLPLSSTEFFDDEAPTRRIEFARDEKGHVISLTFKGLWTTVAKKVA